jgi:hypothetical protein
MSAQGTQNENVRYTFYELVKLSKRHDGSTKQYGFMVNTSPIGLRNRWDRFRNCLFVIFVNAGMLLLFTDWIFYRNSEYELDTTNIQSYLMGIEQLQSIVYIWPPPQHVERMGSKMPLMKNLDFIAATVTNTKRPVTRILDVNQQIPDSIVIKRTHSDSGNHVLFPGNPLINREYLLSQLNIPGAVWFGQSYIPTLRHLGEWRVFIIGGQIIDIAHTRIHHETGCWKWERATRFWSLEELR